jgi:hypothetical protein
LHFYLYVTGVGLRRLVSDESMASFLAWANPTVIFFESEEDIPHTPDLTINKIA